MDFYIKVNDKNYHVPEEALGSEIKTFLKYSDKVGEKNIFDLSNIFKNYVFIYNIYDATEDKNEIESLMEESKKLIEEDNGQTIPQKKKILDEMLSTKLAKEKEIKDNRVEIKKPELNKRKKVIEDIMNICDNIKNYLVGYGITMFSTNDENEASYSKFLKSTVNIKNRFKIIKDKLESERLEQNELKGIYHNVQISFVEMLETLNLLYNGDENKKIK